MKIPSDRTPRFVPGKHMPSLDGVRGLAVLTVFIFHYGGGARSKFLVIRLLGEAIHFGWVGVSLFFVLSGFLISGILWDSFGKSGWWSRFYARRSLRIFPLYYLALIFAILAATWNGAGGLAIERIWIYAIYVQNIPSLNGLMDSFPKNVHLGHFWSLAVEEQFYLIWPLILCKSENIKSAIRFCAIAWVVSLLFRFGCVALHWETAWGNRFLLSRMGELCAGALLALSLRVSKDSQKRTFRVAKIAFWISLFGIGSVIFISGTDQDHPLMVTLGIAMVSILFTSLLAYAIGGGWIESFFKMRIFRWLGKISYGIYVYHLLFRPAFERFTKIIVSPDNKNLYLLTLAVVAAIGTLATSTLSFYTYEQAFLMLKNKFSN